MSDTNPVQCPVCGWTGHERDLDETTTGSACPTCGEAVRATST